MNDNEGKDAGKEGLLYSDDETVSDTVTVASQCGASSKDQTRTTSGCVPEGLSQQSRGTCSPLIVNVPF